ncbi:uncharacterized protein PFL1_04715 [Pseudozyma flocculosa PF-1]|uniref:Related to ABC transporter n=2 Tax=Pseudozyma flocculosa TaxID=84751 RepID=A0A5C3F626_9BASI|nr:uncharacterized protein PFL1_04715 [Pseudozyma flocculosa PF-1]EPQ27577.1 hypothetical protein PFL1_04715 [Pseudozyma flocculosa PF-1]SPO39295.1 related to ABC transporter [Pseudozyma flocculosa]
MIHAPVVDRSSSQLSTSLRPRPASNNSDSHGASNDADNRDLDICDIIDLDPSIAPPQLDGSHPLAEKHSRLSLHEASLWDSLAKFRFETNKEVDILLERVTVQGHRHRPHSLRTVPDAFVENATFFATLGGYLTRCFSRRQQVDTLLSDITARFDPGEMVFVLGRPGSGTEELLQLLSNRTAGLASVQGRFEFAGVPAQQFARDHPAESLYASAYDEHYPTATVEDTIRFALEAKTPKVLPPEMRDDPQRYVREGLDSILELLGIGHVRGSIVGDEHLRGVSGGERKRVSIAEILASGCAVACWDQSTRGMDSTTALSFVKGLRMMSRLFGVINIASFYQVSDDILGRFDKVVVLEHGRQVFYGPPSALVDHFASLGFVKTPAQTTSDFVTACLSGSADRGSATSPDRPLAMTAADFEHVFRASPLWARLQEQVAAPPPASSTSTTSPADVTEPPPAYRLFEQAVKGERRKGLILGRTSYTVPFRHQVKALLRRDLRRKARGWPDLVALYGFNLCISILIGTGYLLLASTASGAFMRGGLLYLTILYPPFEAFGLVATWMESATIGARHVEYRFHSPSASELAFWLAEMPSLIPQLFVFLLPLYFLSGLERTAGAFFTLYLVVFGVYNTFIFFYRASIAFLGHDFSAVMRFNVVMLTGSIIFSGYLVPLRSLPSFTKWLYYVNPIRYAWQATMTNEFRGLVLECDPDQVVPRNVDGLDLGYGSSIADRTQACNIAGAGPGDSSVRGSDYLRSAFGFSATSSEMWRNIGILFAFALGLLLLALVGAEISSRRLRAQPPGQVAVRRGKSSVAAQADDDVEKSATDRVSTTTEAASPPSASRERKLAPRAGLTWTDVSYDVPAKGGSKRLLHNITGFAPRGTLTALMGGSGAGKTTLLDVLARRKTIGKVQGTICFEGRPTDAAFSRHLAYCEQMDVHEPTSTVYEALLFSSKLRRPTTTTPEEHRRGVLEALELLELRHLADTQIGHGSTGISTEARKKLTIGVELVAQPDSVIFLDEPTSGLDAQAATTIVATLRKLADQQGLSCVCTIHQPSAQLFESFDRLMLLGRGGVPVYCGEIGEGSSAVLSSFARHADDGFHRDDANPAETIIALVGGDPENAQRWERHWRESPECRALHEQVAALNTAVHDEAAVAAAATAPASEEGYPTFFRQLCIVLGRELRAQWRSPDYYYTAAVVHLATSLLVGLTWLQLGTSATDLQNRVFAIFVAIFLPAFIFAQVQPVFMESRKVFVRESASGTYGRVVFGAAQLLGQVPGAVGATVLYFVPFYYLCGLPAQSSRAGFVFLVLLVAELYAFAAGQAIAALAPNLAIAGVMLPFILIVYELFAGVTIPGPDMVRFWRSWLYELNPYTRLVSALLTSVLHEVPVRCQGESEVVSFLPPVGQTCGQYAAAFVEAVRKGYIVNPDEAAGAGACAYCPYRVGDDFTDGLGFHYSLRWREFGILVAHWCSMVVILLAACKFINYNRR